MGGEIDRLHAVDVAKSSISGNRQRQLFLQFGFQPICSGYSYTGGLPAKQQTEVGIGRRVGESANTDEIDAKGSH